MNLGTAFRRLTFATALWAFLTLCSTGQLHLPVVIVFLVVLFAAWRYPRLGAKLPAFLWTIISLLVFVAAVCGWFIYFERMYAATYLFFYLELNRLLLARSNRDWAQVYALTFFHILAASVSTEAVLIAPMIAVYMLLIIAAMMVFTIKRDAETAFAEGRSPHRNSASPGKTGMPARLTQPDVDHLRNVARFQWLTRRFGWSLTAMTFFVLLGGMGLFWLIPRSANKAFFSPFGPGADATRMSGFADNVDFGGVGEIQTDPSIVMRASPLLRPGQQEPSFLRIRGTALDVFNGRNWSKSESELRRRAEHPNTRGISFSELMTFVNTIPSERTMDFRLTVEPETSGYLFAPDQPVRIELEREVRVDVDSSLVSARLIMPRNVPIVYTTTSYVSSDQLPGHSQLERDVSSTTAGIPAAIRNFGEKLIGDVRLLTQRSSGSEFVRTDDLKSSVYLSVPNFEGRDAVISTTAEWVEGLTEPAAVAERIEERFKTGFEYSLESDFSNRSDHLAVFLTEARSGHCEYFATVMVLMLRERGIPARIVNGYLTDEWMDSANRFIVRQEHAHSWVEARVDDTALWRTFDPTPASGIGSNRTGDSFYRWWSRIMDAAKLYWYESVIDYSVDDQKSRLQMILGGISRISDKSQTGLEAMRQWWWGSERDGSGGARQAIPLMAGAGLGIAVLAALIYLARMRIGSTGRKRLTGREREIRHDLKPYVELLREAEALYPRKPAETPRAWARSVATESSLNEFVPLTDAYYRARYEDTPFDEAFHATVHALRERIRELRTATRRSSRSGVVRKPAGLQ